jgi:hypothetical protein
VLRRPRRLKDDGKKPLIAGVERSLPFGFRRRRLSWSATLAETTIGLGLDRSRWSAKYQILLGVQPNDFINPYFSFERDVMSGYGVRAWGEFLLPEGTDLRCFDLDSAMEPAERADLVAPVIALLVPYLLEWSTIEGLRAIAARQSPAYSVHNALKRWLGVPLPPLPPGARSAEYENPKPFLTPPPPR